MILLPSWWHMLGTSVTRSILWHSARWLSTGLFNALALDTYWSWACNSGLFNCIIIAPTIWHVKLAIKFLWKWSVWIYLEIHANVDEASKNSQLGSHEYYQKHMNIRAKTAKIQAIITPYLGSTVQAYCMWKLKIKAVSEQSMRLETKWPVTLAMNIKWWKQNSQSICSL